ncbi:hypothetical protein HK101_011686 [Irineochytrium annulatum]|nr:hypothetical protein HK101_011686 [Irineochytrium annulatum]
MGPAMPGSIADVDRRCIHDGPRWTGIGSRKVPSTTVAPKHRPSPRPEPSRYPDASARHQFHRLLSLGNPLSPAERDRLLMAFLTSNALAHADVPERVARHHLSRERELSGGVGHAASFLADAVRGGMVADAAPAFRVIVSHAAAKDAILRGGGAELQRIAIGYMASCGIRPDEHATLRALERTANYDGVPAAVEFFEWTISGAGVMPTGVRVKWMVGEVLRAVDGRGRTVCGRPLEWRKKLTREWGIRTLRKWVKAVNRLGVVGADGNGAARFCVVLHLLADGFSDLGAVEAEGKVRETAWALQTECGIQERDVRNITLEVEPYSKEETEATKALAKDVFDIVERAVTLQPS